MSQLLPLALLGLSLSLSATAQTTDYPISFATDANNASDYQFTGVTIATTSSGLSSITFDTETQNRVYRDHSQHYLKQLSAMPGDAITLTPTLTGTTALQGYLYVDLNQDGQFTPVLTAEGLPAENSELVSFTGLNGRNSKGETVAGNFGAMPAFNLSSTLPHGVYRGRLVIDANAAQPEGSAAISTNGGQIVDFLLNVHANTAKITVLTEHGNVFGTGKALPTHIRPMTPLPVNLKPVAAGYVRTNFVVRHGHNLDGPQFVHGNRQWAEESPNLRPQSTVYIIPAAWTDNNVEIVATFAPTPEAAYLPLLTEEFNLPNGSQPNSSLWRRSTRHAHITWARYISNSPDVVYVEDGNLVCRAIPTPEGERANGETAEMLSGAVESRGLFDFQYGKIEARILTAPYEGNFPAFWMMPRPVEGQKGWPHEGEIDIWEQVNTDNTSVHTIHTNWTYNLGKRNEPQSSLFKGDVDMTTYHTYGVEWTPKAISWFVDGVKVFTYSKSTNQNALSQGQWPFDRPFYIILNQSCGNQESGSWARKPVLTHTYETRFDWVRVYQTKEENPALGIEKVAADEDATATAYDLSGKVVANPAKGIYIVDGQKKWCP